MNNPSLIGFLFLMSKLLGAGGIIFAISHLSNARPKSAIMRFVRHRRRIWFALVLAFLPMTLGGLLSARFPLIVGLPNGLDHAVLAANLIFSSAQGTAYGLAGCCLAHPEAPGLRFPHWKAFGIAAVLGLILSWLSMLVSNSNFLTLLVPGIILATFLVSRIALSKSALASPGGPALSEPKSPSLALWLAFTPAAILLFTFTFFRHPDRPPMVFVAACLVSVVCCFASSILLFRRNTGLAIVAGIVFLLMNAAISLLFGCGVAMSGVKF